MNTQPLRLRSPQRVASLLAVTVLAALLPASAAADDVDLISNGQQDPYVFFLLDVSGSMNRSVPCSAEDVQNGLCRVACWNGECNPRLSGDDPDSRLYVAKEALYSVMETTQGVNFGFGTFGQNELRVHWKHHWYEVSGLASGLDFKGVQLNNGTGTRILFPATTDATGATIPGERHLFGRTIRCDDVVGSPDGDFPNTHAIGCDPDEPARLDHPWEYEKVLRIWKLGDDGNGPSDPDDSTYYVRDPGDGRVYQVIFFDEQNGNRPGDDPLAVRIQVNKCDLGASTSNGCAGNVVFDDTIVFRHVAETIVWEDDPPQNPDDYVNLFTFMHRREQDISGQNFWEPNTDTSNDSYNGYNIKYETVADPLGRGAAYAVGDVIPWDWRDDRRTLIKGRMAPNTMVNSAATPDFGYARYFNDHRQSGENFLRLKTQFYDPSDPAGPRAKPFVSRGGTPTGYSMEGVRDWLKAWLPVADDANNGDKDLDCKTLNVIVVTDGQASDGNRACDATNDLFNLVANNGETYHVRSWALALGDETLVNSGFTNVLNCIADNGGSGDSTGVDIWPPGAPDGEPDGPGPLFAKNKQELIDQMQAFLKIIGGTAKSFSAAAVQRSSSNVDEKIVLSSFVPVPENDVWPGRVDAYLKPVPRKTVSIEGEQRQVPDRAQRCSGPNDDGCLLWDAGEQLVLQAPDDSQIAAADFNLGSGADERRVFYAAPNAVGVPDARVMLDTPTSANDWENLTEALKICVSDPSDATVLQSCAADTAKQTEVIDVLKFIYRKKTFEDPDTLNMVPYVLGEVFHSAPDVTGSPDNFNFFVQNRNDYRDYFAEHRFRRKMLAVNSNDGQLHVIDAGIYRGNEDDGAFDNGTGRELFAFAPREPMPELVEMADPTKRARHRYLNDGSPVHFDVFIDPSHNGTPDPTQREWRTVIVSGLREGGASYYALDVTEPDNRDTNDVPDVSSGTGYLPTASGFPTLLWEFRDRGSCAAFTLGQTDPVNFPNDPRCDDDQNKLPDLGDTWSTPQLGLLRVCGDTNCNTLVEKSVMVVGGGMDALHKKAANRSGNYLYMIDIETGRAIYKRRLGIGSAPSEPAAMDLDKDGVLDTIYIGTTAGELFKVDLRTPKPLVSLGGALQVTDAAWSPFKIFDTGGRPIYFRPGVIFVQDLGRFALAFGTGDRENLWEDLLPDLANDDGRFFIVLDKFDTLDPLNPPTPLTETNLTRIDLTSGNSASNFLDPGWFFPLSEDERLITPATTLAGLTVFSTFQPTVELVQNAVCASRGDSKVYVVFTTNGNAVADDRFEVVESLLSETFLDEGAIDTRDDPPDEDCGEAGQPPCPEEPPPPSCHDSERSKRIAQELMKLFPKNCRFTGETICLVATEDTTNLKVLAPIPICTIERNWKEL